MPTRSPSTSRASRRARRRSGPRAQPGPAAVGRALLSPDQTSHFSASSASLAFPSSARWPLPTFGIAEVEGGQRIDHGCGDDDPGVPLVVGGHDVPGGVGRGGVRGSFLRRPACSPSSSRARPQVVGGELPVLVRILEPLEEASLLLLARDVEEELADEDAVAAQVALVGADVLGSGRSNTSASTSEGGSFCFSRISGCTRTTSTSS